MKNSIKLVIIFIFCFSIFLVLTTKVNAKNVEDNDSRYARDEYRISDCVDGWRGFSPPSDRLVRDTDCDGVIDSSPDNCPLIANPDQLDMDTDDIGDVCDSDIDGDGYPNEFDNCPQVFNRDQADANEDGLGDACVEDMDGDGILDEDDNCPYISNPEQEHENESVEFGDACYDTDEDGVKDAFDNCRYLNSSIHDDYDEDGVGDVCDNCYLVFNPDQADHDENGVGNVCESNRKPRPVIEENHLVLNIPTANKGVQDSRTNVKGGGCSFISAASSSLSSWFYFLNVILIGLIVRKKLK